jgi:hypothetical protein
MVKKQTLLCAKELSLQHGFNEANDELIRICGAEVSTKKCENSLTKPKINI